MKVYLLYGLSKNATESWQEDLLYTQENSDSKIAFIKEIAAKDGFHSFRVAIHIDGAKPDFAKTVAI